MGKFEKGNAGKPKAICDIRDGKIIKKPQDARFSTFEPSINVSDIYKPDLLMLNYNG